MVRRFVRVRARQPYDRGSSSRFGPAVLPSCVAIGTLFLENDVGDGPWWAQILRDGPAKRRAGPFRVCQGGEFSWSRPRNARRSLAGTTYLRPIFITRNAS